MFSQLFVCPQGGVSVTVRGFLSRGEVSVQGDLCSGGSLSREGFLSRGISVQEGLCPGGLCPGGLCPGGLCPGRSLSRGVSVQGSPCPGGGPLSREGSQSGDLCQGGGAEGGSLSRGIGRYASYWNALLFCFNISLRWST